MLKSWINFDVLSGFALRMQILASSCLQTSPEQSQTIQSLTQVFERNPGLLDSVPGAHVGQQSVPLVALLSIPFPFDLSSRRP